MDLESIFGRGRRNWRGGFFTDRYKEDGTVFVRHQIPKRGGGYLVQVHPDSEGCDLCPRRTED